MTRLFVEYTINGPKNFPLDYRSAFMALIKTALDHNIKYFDGMFQKRPLCTAIRFDQKPVIKNNMIFIGNKIRFYISSPDQDLIANIYNGLLRIKQFTIFDSALSKPKFVYLNEYSFHHHTKMFHTLSPIVIRNYQDRTKYVTPTDECFMESLTNSLREQWEMYNETPLSEVKCKIIKFKKAVLTHYGGLVLGFTGLLTLESEPRVLDFFYKAGFGYRRSNGFGLLEVDR